MYSCTPSQTKRGHSPTPKFPPSYNFHVNVGSRGRQGVRYRDSDSEFQWPCNIPDVTDFPKPDLGWMNRDLGETLSALFTIPGVSAISPSNGPATPAMSPAQPSPQSSLVTLPHYQGIYHIPAGCSTSEYSDWGSNGCKLLKYVSGKR